MKPVSPVVPGLPLPECIYAKDQPQYKPLPAYRDDEEGTVLSRWHVTWKERLEILFSGNIWVRVRTFKHPLQPMSLHAECPLQPPAPRLSKSSKKGLI